MFCRHKNMVLVTPNLCDACNTGNANPCTYECDRCNQQQRIPHPMYRYQPSPQEFGGATWACHISCHDYTHWRIVESDIDRIPGHEIPTSWAGFENQRLQVARDAYASKMKDFQK